MCRLMVFCGACTTCGREFTWCELTQELSCLEAKNAGAFGECKRGVLRDEHAFDQECDGCAEEAYDVDEGVGLDDTEPAGGRREGKEGKEVGGEGGGKGEKEKEKDDDDGRRRKKQRLT